ncbi:HAD family hydrolase [Streptomyces erythrochromogenes]|uniref:HAD family hydrolase n=1 Tax=Streptomyces erythrochromogenes TaxID=285574 RepID=UPI0036C3E749
MPTQAETLRAVLGASKAVLFDFDGPVCDVFHGIPASGIADELASLITVLAPALEHSAKATDDPMKVHRLSEEGGGTVLASVEAALTAAEMRAVKVAGVPTAGATEALQAARYSGRRVAIVSNNSAECIQEYLRLHGLAVFVDHVIGRPRLRPDLMKPSPHPLLSAASALDVAPSRTVLVGDSVSDIEAARAAGGPSVGYANKPHKRASLANAGASAVVLQMQEIADALRVPE